MRRGNQPGERDLAREGDRPSAPSLLPTPASEMELSVLVRNRLERKKRTARSARITSDDGSSDEDAMEGAEEEDATGRPPVLMVRSLEPFRPGSVFWLELSFHSLVRLLSLLVCRGCCWMAESTFGGTISRWGRGQTLRA